MKLISAALGLAALAGTAHADGKADVTALVLAEVNTVGDPVANSPALVTTKDFVEVAPFGTSLNRTANFYGLVATKIKQKLGPLTIVVDGDGAWFAGTVEASYLSPVCRHGCMDDTDKPEKQQRTWRISGVAFDDHGWKLAAFMWAPALADADLMKLAADATKSEPSLLGDKQLAGDLVQWIHDGLAHAGNDKAETLVAAGTAPTERAVGPAPARKLAASWDKLALWVGKAEGHDFKHGIAFVTADVYMPVKKGAVPMQLGAILMRDKGGWSWVSLSFAPAPAY